MIKSFYIGGIKYTVEEVDNIEGRVLGQCYLADKKIFIAKSSYGREVTDEGKEQTLIHEVIHAILDELGYTDLSGDEKFVQSFSLLLHQFYVSKDDGKQ